MIKELEKDNLNEIVSNNETVIVQYMAGWCGNCRLMKPKFKNWLEKTRALNSTS